MPSAAQRPCAWPGCAALVSRGRCPAHRAPSSAQRGYGAAWRGARLAVLRDEPTCRACRKLGRLTLARDVDHIVPKELGGSDERSNLQPLCEQCHVEKTIVDNATIERSHAW